MQLQLALRAVAPHMRRGGGGLGGHGRGAGRTEAPAAAAAAAAARQAADLARVRLGGAPDEVGDEGGRDARDELRELRDGRAERRRGDVLEGRGGVGDVLQDLEADDRDLEDTKRRVRLVTRAIVGGGKWGGAHARMEKAMEKRRMISLSLRRMRDSSWRPALPLPEPDTELNNFLLATNLYSVRASRTLPTRRLMLTIAKGQPMAVRFGSVQFARQRNPTQRLDSTQLTGEVAHEQVWDGSARNGRDMREAELQGGEEDGEELPRELVAGGPVFDVGVELELPGSQE